MITEVGTDFIIEGDFAEFWFLVLVFLFLPVFGVCSADLFSLCLVELVAKEWLPKGPPDKNCFTPSLLFGEKARMIVFDLIWPMSS